MFLEEGSNIFLPWMEYNQISSLIAFLQRKQLLRTSLSLFETLLSSETCRNKGLISTLYNVLLSPYQESTLPAQKAWHKDLNYDLSQEQWEEVWAFPLRYFRSLNILLSVFKLSSRWYLTPTRLAHMSRNSSRLCWKGCGLEGSFFHLWWSCKFVSQFWSHILAFIKKITGITVPKDPGVILLNLWDRSCIPTNNRELVFSLLLAAKATIAFFWKKPSPPTVEYWTQKIWDFIVFDKVLFGLNINTISDPLAVYNKWYLVLDYFSQHSIIKLRTPLHISQLIYH